ncbi:unconventional myosin-XV-like [Candoia aspera]|uniref:unconventional myosin-XV-like n=1 Tax=Candoia aspera TaxID=51853 RepID=UPI002FD84374
MLQSLITNGPYKTMPTQVPTPNQTPNERGHARMQVAVASASTMAEPMYGVLVGHGPNCLQKRDGCTAVLSQVIGDISGLFQIGVTKVFLKEKAWQMLEKQRNQKLTWAIVTLQCNLRGLIKRRQFQVFRQKIIVIQAHFRGHLARKRYQRLKKTLLQFGVAILVSGPLVHTVRHYKAEQPFREGSRAGEAHH